MLEQDEITRRLMMRKTFGVLLIIFGCLFGGVSLWSVKGYLTEDTSDSYIKSDCKVRITAGDYDKWEGDEAMGRCVEDGWKAMGMVYPTYIALISVFGILSILFLLSGRRVIRRKRPPISP